MKVERTESRIEDVLTTLMPKEVLKESLALKFSFLGDRFFPNGFSYGVFANVGSGALPGRLPGAGSRRFRGRFRITGSGKVPGRFRGRFRTTFRTTGSRKVPRQVPNHGFREGSGQVPGQVPNDRFREGSGAGSEPRVPGRFRGRFRTTISGKVPGQVPGRSRSRFLTTFRGFQARF